MEAIACCVPRGIGLSIDRVHHSFRLSKTKDNGYSRHYSQLDRRTFYHPCRRLSSNRNPIPKFPRGRGRGEGPGKGRQRYSQLSEELGAGVLVRLPGRRGDQPRRANGVAKPRLHLAAVEEVVQVVLQLRDVA